MTVKEWLELGKPENVRFIIERETETLKVKDNPDFILIMADMILGALAHYTDSSFGTEPIKSILGPDYLLEHKGHQFSVIADGAMVHVGTMAHKLKVGIS